MKRGLTLALIVLSMLLISCVIKVNDQDYGLGTISCHDGNKDYSNQTDLAGKFPGDFMDFGLGCGDINLKPSPDGQYHLHIQYKEEVAGDAVVTIDGSNLNIRSKTHKNCYVCEVTGTIPPQTKIHLRTGSGDIRLVNFNNNPEILIKLGSGDAKVDSCVSVQSMTLEAGSGDLSLNHLSMLPELVVKTGSGDIALANSRDIDRAECTMGSGNLEINACDVRYLETKAGSGDVTMSRSHIGEFVGESGSGDLNLNQSRIDRRTFRSGSGSIEENPNIN